MTQCICITISKAQSFINSKLRGIYFPCPGIANFKVWELTYEMHVNEWSLSQSSFNDFNLLHGLDIIFSIWVWLVGSDSDAPFSLSFWYHKFQVIIINKYKINNDWLDVIFGFFWRLSWVTSSIPLPLQDCFLWSVLYISALISSQIILSEMNIT